MAVGPARHSLNQDLDSTDPQTLDEGIQGWRNHQRLLKRVADALENASTADIRGESGVSMRGAFGDTKGRVEEKVATFEDGERALEKAWAAIDHARERRVALDNDDDTQTVDDPGPFEPDPDRESTEDDAARDAHRGKARAFEEREAKRERIAGEIKQELVDKLNEAAGDMQKIHGEPVPQPAGPGSPTGPAGPGGAPPPLTPAAPSFPGSPPGGPGDPHVPVAPADPHNPNLPEQPDGPPVIGDVTPPGPTGPSDADVPGDLVAGAPPTSGVGGADPASPGLSPGLIGGVGAAGLGAGLAGAAIKGGLVPGQPLRANGVRGIGSGGRPVGPSTLGRGAAGTGSPVTRGAGRGAAAGGTTGRRGGARAGTAGQRGGKGAGAGAAGRRGQRKSDDESTGREREYDIDDDWLDDEGVGPDVLR